MCELSNFSTESCRLASWKLYSPAWTCSDSEQPFQGFITKLQYAWWIFPFDSVVQWSVEQLGLGEGFYPPCGLVDFNWYLLATWNYKSYLATNLSNGWEYFCMCFLGHAPALTLRWACCLLPAPGPPPGSISLLQNFFLHLTELWTTTNSDS